MDDKEVSKSNDAKKISLILNKVLSMTNSNLKGDKKSSKSI